MKRFLVLLILAAAPASAQPPPSPPPPPLITFWCAATDVAAYPARELDPARPASLLCVGDYAAATAGFAALVPHWRAHQGEDRYWEDAARGYFISLLMVHRAADAQRFLASIDAGDKYLSQGDKLFIAGDLKGAFAWFVAHADGVDGPRPEPIDTSITDAAAAMQAGDSDGALAALQRRSRASGPSSNSSEQALMLGDVFASRRDWSDAFAAWALAANSSHGVPEYDFFDDYNLAALEMLYYYRAHLPDAARAAPPQETPIKELHMPIGEDPNFTEVTPRPQPAGSPDHARVYIAPAAGPNSEMFATVVNPDAAGPQDVFVAVDYNDRVPYYHGKTDQAGNVRFLIPAGASAIGLFRGFGPDGHAKNVHWCNIFGRGDEHVQNTTLVPPSKVPPTGPAITEANSAVERGGTQQGLMILHVRNIDPLHTHVLLDGTTDNVTTLAASDLSVVAKIDEQAQLREYEVSLESNGRTSNAAPVDLVTFSHDPLPPLQVGVPVPVSVRVVGLPPGHTAIMHFALYGGAVHLVSGGDAVDLPVNNGVATVTLLRSRAGEIQFSYTLTVTIPGYWDARD